MWQPRNVAKNVCTRMLKYTKQFETLVYETDGGASPRNVHKRDFK